LEADFFLILLILLQFLGFVVGFTGYNSLSSTLRDYADRLNEVSAGTSIDLEPMATKMTGIIEDIVADTLQNLEPPRAIDHVFGAVAQMIQARTMKMMQLPSGVGEVVQMVHDHLSPEEEQENV
jgi:hypothetical protein